MPVATLDNRPTARPIRTGPLPAPAAAGEQECVGALNSCLAHVIDLGLRTRRAHWNAKGGSFYALHKMFDTFSHELDSLADELGERVIAVGGVAIAHPGEVASLSALPQAGPASTRADDVLAALKADYDRVRAELRLALTSRAMADDDASADIIVGAMKLVDRQRSFIRAQLGEP